MKPIIIGIDHGYAAIKTVNFTFPSGVTEFETPPPVNQGLLEIDGKYYVCGSGRQPLLKDKATNENYWLLTLAALAKEVSFRADGDTAEVIIAAGLPLTGFGKDKEAFRNYLLRNAEPIIYKFEEREFCIQIKDVFLLPQGFSAIAANMHLLSNEPSVVIIDIGGWTVDVMRMDNKKVDTTSCRSLELGVIRCMDEIKEQVRRVFGLSLTDSQVQAIISDEPCSIPGLARELVVRHGQMYVDRLLSEIAECGFDLQALPAVFLGGGASIVKPRVTARVGLCGPIFLTDAAINAKAFESLVRQRVAI